MPAIEVIATLTAEEIHSWVRSIEHQIKYSIKMAIRITRKCDLLKGYLSSLWMVSGILRILWICGSVMCLIMGDDWGIDKYKPFNYLSDFAENWLKGV